jgi:hypothetical protein
MNGEAGDERLEGDGVEGRGAVEASRGIEECWLCFFLSPTSFQKEKPVCCLPRELLPGPDMNHRWQIFVLWVFSVLILWLMATYLDPEPESAPLEKWIYSVPWHCNYLWLKFGKCGCPCGTLNCSSCHHTVREWNWFEGYHAKTTEYLMRTKVLWWLVSGQHWALSCLFSHEAQPSFHFFGSPSSPQPCLALSPLFNLNPEL